MLTSCQTCPESQEENVKTLDPGYFPELPDLSILDGSDKRIVIDFMIDAYSEHLILLLSSRVTGRFTDDIETEIFDCRDSLDWLESLKLENDLLN